MASRTQLPRLRTAVSSCFFLFIQGAFLLSAQTYQFKTIQAFQPNGTNNSGVLVGQTGIPVAGIYRFGEFLTSISDPTLPVGGNTVFSGVNDEGVIVGLSDVRGFSLKNGAFSTVTVLGVACSPISINDAGDIAGSYGPDNLGFVLHRSSVSTLPYPVTGINNHGDVVLNSNNNGYLLKGGVTTPIVYPSSISTYVSGLNDSDTVVGFYTDAQFVSHGFVWSNGVYTAINYPQATFTRTQAIDNSGRVSGFALTASSLDGFIATPVQKVARTN